MFRKQTIAAIVLMLSVVVVSFSEGTFFTFGDNKTTINESTQKPQHTATAETYVQTIGRTDAKTTIKGNYGTSSAEYYYYSLLDGNDRKVYETILDGLRQEKKEIIVNTTDKNSIIKIVSMVIYDHPELFYIEYEGEYRYTIYDSYTVLEPGYSCTGKKRIRREKKIEKSASAILDNIRALNTDYDKIKAIYEYVIDNTDYKLGAPDNQSIYSVLVNKKSVCAGYTRTMQYLLQKLGIETIYVTGTVQGSGKHSWNIVKCNGKYYHIDATSGEMYIDNIPKKDIPSEIRCCHEYLFCTDKQIYRNRTVDKIAKLPKCSSADLGCHALEGTYFKKYSDKVINSMKSSICSGKTYWSCGFKTKQEFDKCLARVKGGIYADKVMEYKNSKGSIDTWYIYNENMYTITCWYR